MKAALICLAFGLAQAQSYRFTEFSITGAEIAIPNGINNSGQIAGIWSPSVNSNVSHGFVRNPDGTATTFDAPACANTRVGGINNLGEVACWCQEGGHAFLRTTAGVFTSIDIPGAPGFYPTGINDRGDVVGFSGILWAGGYVRHSDGSAIEVKHPTMSTEPAAINNRGDVAGTGLSGSSMSGTSHAFLRTAEGVYSRFDFPGTSAGTGIIAINNRGQIAGHSPAAAFVSNADGSFTLLPGYNLSGMNDNGVIVGVRYSLSAPAGFRPVIGTPDPTPLPPTIRTALPGVLSASAFGGASTIAPGTWIEIYGNTLGGATSVTIAGRTATVSYTSPGQVNALVPAGVPPGFADVVITTPVGKTAPYSVKVEAFQPSILACPLAGFRTANNVMAFFPDWTYVTADRPARAGNTIVLFAMGLGPDPRVEVVFDTVYGTTAVGTVTYAGPVPGALGLDQLNVVVPNLELYPGASIDNIVHLTVTVNGKTTEAATGRGLLIAIGK